PESLRLQESDRQQRGRTPGEGRLLRSAVRPKRQGGRAAQGIDLVQIVVRVHASGMHKLEIRGLTKRYELERERRQVLALSDVSLSVSDGEFMAIVGPSGCGKTSLLNIVAGLLRYDGGEVVIDGKKVTGAGVDRAVVFQQASLLAWRTGAGHVRYGMEMQRRFDATTMQRRTEQFVGLVGLTGFERHYP